MTKYIFVHGGVISGLGKGIVAASIGNLLTRFGFSVSVLKCDPYINVDPGTMNPKQHGEVFVTADGGETDLDLGHYERFVGHPLSKLSSITAGSVYQSVISKERKGVYDGATVQIFHITNEIKSRIYNLASITSCDFLIVEIGGTIGDLESLPFVEAVRQIQTELDKNSTCSVHVSYVPFLSCSNEHKTKPTQHSVKELRGLGISPDIIVTRPEGKPLSHSILDKISQFSYVKRHNVIDCPNLPSLYLVPELLFNNGIISSLKSLFNLSLSSSLDPSWSSLTKQWHEVNLNSNFSSHKSVTLVGKYTQLQDSYISVIEALQHAALSLNMKLDVGFYDTTSDKECNLLAASKSHGVIVPGGFGESGINKIIDALTFTRENQIPTLGICLGMQLMCVEFFQHHVNLNSHSREFSNDVENFVIDFMPDQHEDLDLGGTLRLGTYPAKLKPDTVIKSSYKEEVIYERHRHRYELNNQYRKDLTDNGLVLSSTSPDDRLVESVELPTHVHPFYLGVQFHPEFLSNPTKPHPLFVSFLKSLLDD